MDYDKNPKVTQKVPLWWHSNHNKVTLLSILYQEIMTVLMLAFENWESLNEWYDYYGGIDY